MIFKYLVISDIHLGHNINKTPYIVSNLKSYFRDYSKELNNLQAIFLAGDIFDKLLPNSSGDYLLAIEWLTELILYCKHNKIKLRILEGTPSHDWNQARLISSVIAKLNIEVDYKYIDTLHIEYLEYENLYILYVPDEYKKNAKDTYEEIKLKLQELNITQVDIAIMHGAFHYQLPMVKLESSHTEEDYLNIVKYYISIGHIHTPSVYGRILAQGSFDRLAHNEEEDKGAMLITITDVSDSYYKFLKNKNAMVFKTIKFKNESIDKICNTVRSTLSKLPMYSNIKIISEVEEHLSSALKILTKEYPTYNIKIDKIKNKNNTTELVKQEVLKNSISITKDNIKDLLLEEVKKYNLEPSEYSVLLQELDSVLN